MKIIILTLLYISLHLGTINTFAQDNKIVPLITAIQANDLTYIETLLAYPRLNLEDMDDDGNTPLHLAVQYGHFSVIKYLIEQGSKLTANNEASPYSFRKGINRLTSTQLTAFFSLQTVINAIISLDSNLQKAILSDL